MQSRTPTVSSNAEDSTVRDFAVDPMLLRAGIAHEGEWTAFVNELQPGIVTVRVAGHETTLGREAAEKLLVMSAIDDRG